MILEGLFQRLDQHNELLHQQNELLTKMLSQTPSPPATQPAQARLEPLIPLQRTRRRSTDGRRVPPAIVAVSRNRAWELLVEAEGKGPRTVSDLAIALLAEGHFHVTPRDVTIWLTRWEQLGRLRRLTDNRVPAYELVEGGRERVSVDDHFMAPSPDDPVPFLLRAAFDEVKASGKGCLHARTLAAATGIRSTSFGTHLGPLLREVGILRPADKRVREVPGGPLAPGYTEECLGKAVAAYEARAANTVKVPAGQGV